MSSSVEISAIVCTHNRAALLEKCIGSIVQQSLDRDRYEIIVVDNASTDNTSKTCAKYQHESFFRYVYESCIGLSRARNAGWQMARGEYVGYIDDDATAGSKWLEKALWSFKNVNPMPEWVGGPIRLDWESDAPEWITEEYRTALGEVYWGNNARFLDGPGERLGGGNSFYQKRVLEEMGGFDVRLGRQQGSLLSGEETQFQHRLRARGGRLYYHPDVYINHSVIAERIVPVWFYRRYYWGGYTDCLIGATLKRVQYKKVGGEPTQHPFVVRFAKNTWNALGLFSSRSETIHGRIYLSYAVGRIWGLLCNAWRNR